MSPVQSLDSKHPLLQPFLLKLEANHNNHARVKVFIRWGGEITSSANTRPRYPSSVRLGGATLEVTRGGRRGAAG